MKPFLRGNSYYIKFRFTNHPKKDQYCTCRIIINGDKARPARTLTEAKNWSVDSIERYKKETIGKVDQQSAYGDVRLDWLWEEFQEGYDLRVNDESLDTYNAWMRVFIQRFEYVSKVSPRSIRAFQEEDRRTNSVTTTNKKIALLKRVLNWCASNKPTGADNYFIKENPIQNFRLEKARDVDVIRKSRILTDKERYRLLRTIMAEQFREIRWIVLLSLYLGLRKEESTSVTVKQFDLVEGIVHIEGKGGKKREIDLPRIIVKRIDEIFSSCKSGYIFQSYKFGQGREKVFNENVPIKNIRRSWNRLKKISKIDNFHFHCLRHSCISWWLNNKGVNPSIAKDWAGHTDLQTTMKYLHTDKEAKRREVAKI